MAEKQRKQEISNKGDNRQIFIDNYMKARLGLELKGAGFCVEKEPTTRDISTRMHDIMRYKGFVNGKETSVYVVLPNKENPSAYVFLGDRTKEIYNSAFFETKNADVTIPKDISSNSKLSDLLESKGIMVPEIVQERIPEKKVSLEDYLMKRIGLNEKHRFFITEDHSLNRENSEHDLTKYNGKIKGNEITVCVVHPNEMDPNTYILLGKKAEKAYLEIKFDKYDQSNIVIQETENYPSSFDAFFEGRGIPIPKNKAPVFEKRKTIDFDAYMKEKGYYKGPENNGIGMYYKNVGNDVKTVGIKEAKDDRYTDFFFGKKADDVYNGNNKVLSDLWVLNSKGKIPSIDSFLESNEASGEPIVIAKARKAEDLGKLAKAIEQETDEILALDGYMEKRGFFLAEMPIKNDIRLYQKLDSNENIIKVGVKMSYGQYFYVIPGQKADDMYEGKRAFRKQDADLMVLKGEEMPALASSLPVLEKAAQREAGREGAEFALASEISKKIPRKSLASKSKKGITVATIADKVNKNEEKPEETGRGL